MITQKESNLGRKDSWLPKLLSRDMKTKTKKQKSTTNNQKITEKKQKSKS